MLQKGSPVIQSFNIILMTNGFSGVESALSLWQSKAENERHGYSHDLRFLTPPHGKGDVLCVLNVMGPVHAVWRNALGETPVQRLKAREKLDGSEKPSR